ncbi:hypothetical protein TTHERM_00849380 (macronuclear) [Tetrahymena thermophila SB210]|uniref:Uncharacterized protein n=1 Tax=Tetrahymena thermophila (strain SB210) TaxID=312017 RepID=Q23R46_TETTS|nr:hypothetical protein TTHERM_00849380 [Tetrahymena thermophila SB210]EAR98995.1 hypothetical protein TTHERM_00849380 [Tetrahymena thermophila SB210]|eukprot:XP_001019240.1 hypothetical protein TTHERM_00849380 [Tetrahymena thermophila SB210]
MFRMLKYQQKEGEYRKLTTKPTGKQRQLQDLKKNLTNPLPLKVLLYQNKIISQTKQAKSSIFIQRKRIKLMLPKISLDDSLNKKYI